jgi:predicted dithiol-disulfide oxidoreductase (DUF899 family)
MDRRVPMVEITSERVFQGKVGKSRLIVQHFMFGTGRAMAAQ